MASKKFVNVAKNISNITSVTIEVTKHFNSMQNSLPELGL